MAVHPCLTVIQPWATLTALKLKRVETRNWMRADLVGRRLAIHASSRWSADQYRFAVDVPLVRRAIEAAGFRLSADPGAPRMLPMGAVLGTVTVKGFVEYAALSDDAWREVAAASLGDHDHGRYAWILDDFKALETPMPASGRPGLWNWAA